MHVSGGSRNDAMQSIVIWYGTLKSHPLSVCLSKKKKIIINKGWGTCKGGHFK